MNARHYLQCFIGLFSASIRIVVIVLSCFQLSPLNESVMCLTSQLYCLEIIIFFFFLARNKIMVCIPCMGVLSLIIVAIIIWY